MTPSPREPRKLAGYLGAISAFTAGTAALVVGGRLSSRPLPERFALTDVLIGGVATYKFARVISKDAVTTPLRAPFTEFKEPAGSGEVNEEPREDHPAHTVGELLSCPFCLAPWISTGYVAGLTFAPRFARSWAAVFGVVGLADALQHVYARVRTD